jgi:anti-sigma factor RsiW
MNDQTEVSGWEAQINALLDGELDAEQTQSLKAAASKDQALAQAIIAAYQLQQAMEAVPLQRAPDSLRRKLASIPAEQRRQGRPAWFQPAWISALAAVPLFLIALSLTGPKQPLATEPTAAQISQAQQELAVAFSYLEKVGRKTGLEIGTTVNKEMQQTINHNMIRTIQDQMEFNKERSA